jgi:SecD/SecF fusion protein
VTIFFLYILGVSSLKEFAAPLMVGIVCGMISNIFIPCALWYTMGDKKTKAAAAKTAPAKTI